MNPDSRMPCHLLEMSQDHHPQNARQEKDGPKDRGEQMPQRPALHGPKPIPVSEKNAVAVVPAVVGIENDEQHGD